MTSKVIMIVLELMFLGINMLLAPLRAHFNPRYTRTQMILSWAKNIFTPANVNSIAIIVLAWDLQSVFNSGVSVIKGCPRGANHLE